MHLSWKIQYSSNPDSTPITRDVVPSVLAISFALPTMRYKLTRPRNRQNQTVVTSSIHLLQRLLRILLKTETDETEAFTFSRFPITNDIGPDDGTEWREESTEIVVFCVDGEGGNSECGEIVTVSEH